MTTPEAFDAFNQEFIDRLDSLAARRAKEAALDADPVSMRCACGYRRNDPRCCRSLGFESYEDYRAAQSPAFAAELARVRSAA